MWQKTDNLTTPFVVAVHRFRVQRFRVASGSKNRVRGTIADTGHALDALGLVDNGRFLLLPRDGVRRAFFEADAALDAYFLIHLEFDKRRAAFGGAGLVNDVCRNSGGGHRF